jgi:hypothetical protein
LVNTLFSDIIIISHILIITYIVNIGLMIKFDKYYIQKIIIR